MTSDTFISTVRALLEEERDQVLRQLSELGVSNDGALSFDENFADSGQVAAEQGEARVLANTLRDNLADVEAALARLDNGTYGLCERCGDRISEARLEAMPAARRCINCAA